MNSLGSDAGELKAQQRPQYESALVTRCQVSAAERPGDLQVEVNRFRQLF